jgi:group I intron endonuclease
LESSESLISRALLDYGYSHFKLEILEYCEKDKAISREQHYLDHLEHEYNILSTAGSRLGSLHTEEAKAKIRTAAFGRKFSEATRQKLREAVQDKGISNLVPGAGQAAAAAASSKAVLVKNIETGETVEYVSQREAARELGVNVSTIGRHIKSKKLLNQIFIISNKSSD